jgi:hypothetical protein
MRDAESSMSVLQALKVVMGVPKGLRRTSNSPFCVPGYVTKGRGIYSVTRCHPRTSRTGSIADASLPRRHYAVNDHRALAIYLTLAPAAAASCSAPARIRSRIHETDVFQTLSCSNSQFHYRYASERAGL